MSLSTKKANLRETSHGRLYLRDRYDWAVLGDDPAALIAGLLLNQKGLSVLFVPVANSPKENFYYTTEGFGTKNYGIPAIESSYFIGAGAASSLGNRVLERAGVPMVQLKGVLDPVVTQIRWQGQISSVKKDLGQWLCLDQETLEKWKADVSRYWNTTPERSSGSVKQEKVATGPNRILRDLGRNEPSRAALFASMLGTYFKAGDSYRMENLSSIFPMMCSEVRAVGGMVAFQNFLKREARKTGATVLEEHSAQKLFFDDGRVHGVQVKGKNQVIQISGAILGALSSRFFEMAVWSGKGNLKKKTFHSHLVPAGWRFSCGVVFQEGAFASCVPHRMIVGDVGSHPIEIEIKRGEELQRANLNERLLVARVILPFDKATLDEGYVRDLTARLRRRLSELFPFSQAYEASPWFFSHYHNLDQIPDSALVFSGGGLGVKRKTDNVFFANAESRPDLAALSTWVTALEAAELATRFSQIA